MNVILSELGYPFYVDKTEVDHKFQMIEMVE